MTDEKETHSGTQTQQQSPPHEPPITNDAGGGGSPWKWIFIAVIAVIIIIIFTNQSGNRRAYDPDSPAIEWRTDHTAALEEARSQEKPVLMAFHASWCGPCNQMKNTTYHDPEVITAAEDFVRVMVDIDAKSGLAEKYGVSSIPAYVILTPEGEVKREFLGYNPPELFIKKLRGS